MKITSLRQHWWGGLALFGLSLGAQAQTQSSCSVNVSNQWGSGSQVAVTVQNPGTSNMRTWLDKKSFPRR